MKHHLKKLTDKASTTGFTRRNPSQPPSGCLVKDAHVATDSDFTPEGRPVSLLEKKNCCFQRVQAHMAAVQYLPCVPLAVYMTKQSNCWDVYLGFFWMVGIPQPADRRTPRLEPLDAFEEEDVPGQRP